MAEQRTARRRSRRTRGARHRAAGGNALEGVELERAVRRALRTDILGAAKLLGIGLLMCLVVFVATGPHYLQGVRSAMRWQDMLAGMSERPASPAGTPAAIEAIIARDAAPAFHQFVAYVVETKRGQGLRGGWSWWIVEQEQKTAFALDTVQGRLSLASPDYAFTPMQDPILPAFVETSDPMVRDWDHIDHREENLPGGPMGNTRYRGLAAGQPVLVIGTPLDDKRIDADYVIAGNRADFERHLARMASGAENATGFWFMVTAIAVAAGFILCWIAFIIWRIRQ